MAAPTVYTVTGGADGTTVSLSASASRAADDLLTVVLDTPDGGTATTPTGWTLQATSSSSHVRIYTRIADDTATDSFASTLGTSQRWGAVWQAFNHADDWDLASILTDTASGSGTTYQAIAGLSATGLPDQSVTTIAVGGATSAGVKTVSCNTPSLTSSDSVSETLDANPGTNGPSRYRLHWAGYGYWDTTAVPDTITTFQTTVTLTDSYEGAGIVVPTVSTAPSIEQKAFRFRDGTDDALLNEDDHWGAALNTGLLNVDVESDYTLRLRVLLENDGDAAMDSTSDWNLYTRLNGGVWDDFDAHTFVVTAFSARYANGDDTTQVIGSGSASTGDGVEGTAFAFNRALAVGYEIEHEWAIKLVSSQLDAGDLIEFQVWPRQGGDPHAVPDTVTQTPSILVSQPSEQQHLYPDADSAVADWRNELGSAVDLYKSVRDDVDTTYVTDTTDSFGDSSVGKVSITVPDGTPGSTGTAKIHARAKSDSAGQTLAVYLDQGAVQKVSADWSLTNLPVDYSYTLTSGELASITDWSDLTFRFEVYGDPDEWNHIYRLELETPPISGNDKSGSGTITQTHSVTASGKKNAKGTGTITHTHSVVATGTGFETHSGTAAIVQSHTITATGDVAEHRSGSASIIHSHTATAAGDAAEAHSGSASITHTAEVWTWGQQAGTSQSLSPVDTASTTGTWDETPATPVGYWKRLQRESIWAWDDTSYIRCDGNATIRFKLGRLDRTSLDHAGFSNQMVSRTATDWVTTQPQQSLVLYEGAVERYAGTPSNITAPFSHYSRGLTEAVLDTITDFDDLYLEIRITNLTAGEHVSLSMTRVHLHALGGEAAIVHGHAVTATGVSAEAHSGAGTITQGHTVTTAGVKNASGIAAISHPVWTGAVGKNQLQGTVLFNEGGGYDPESDYPLHYVIPSTNWRGAYNEYTEADPYDEGSVVKVRAYAWIENVGNGIGTGSFRIRMYDGNDSGWLDTDTGDPGPDFILSATPTLFEGTIPASWIAAVTYPFDSGYYYQELVWRNDTGVQVKIHVQALCLIYASPQEDVVLVHGHTAIATGTKNAAGTGAIAQGHTVTATGVKDDGGNDKSGSGAIAQGHTVTASGVKNAKGTASVAQGHTVVATGDGFETHSGTASITQGHSVVATGAKGASGAGTVTHGHTTTATGVKEDADNRAGSGSIVHTGVVTATGRKDVTGTATIAPTHSVVATGQGFETHTGTASIVQGHTVTATGTKVTGEHYSGSGTITAGHSVVAVGQKNASGAGVVVVTDGVTATGKKVASGVATITETHVITATYSMWIITPRTTGRGYTDDGAPLGRATRSQDLGLTDDATQPGVTDGLQSIGRTE